MPHIVFNNEKNIKTPFEKNGVDFKFCAKSYNFTKEDRRVEYKIGVSYESKDFLLTLKDKNDNRMLKADKVTRVTPVTLVKDALNAYVEEIGANIVFSNTNSFNQKIEPKKEYLKDIQYFVDDFKTNKEIQIEIGFGSGRHLLYQAKKNPNVQFIGLEIHTPSIEQLLKQLKIQEIDNVLVVNYDARLFMEFIDSNKVGKIFVHFPVPWDKKPHRRIYSNEFIDEALRVLMPKGTLELRSDSRKYFDYCVELLTNLNSGKITIDINKDLEVSSKYEDRWKKQGKNIYDVVLQCQREDEDIDLKYDFSFGKINLEKFKDIISNKPMLDENFFIHIEDLFLLDEPNSGLIEVTFGSFNRPLSKYIYVENNKASYYQGSPLPTSSNIKAHERLKEILK
ncbi:tRNA (guanosine(46)-N7)-methyltransferase TrmB [Malaciobacter marinus]|uniref:tRNA (guanine-N(7)-)-methyltransferase n=1 Tax=Malaciobacter marinus TaxID=505249 RepID=A0A347TJU6_9BACT|nr:MULTISPECIES: tRNA (guanosine(46)-N7)-methyltransferase TrmB [Malaciobacter]AXX86874.1 tRNA m7G46 methyltransferase [Malaciobacter marinus]PHO15831.1 tRNA (guanosine(46)-N7)-methyltransferase TrmB [Malaciobacter marinus]RYA23819.1 tRNA (guanosine(46)-N7)-methyltransferase TrmB [Malaciobacter halophilus]